MVLLLVYWWSLHDARLAWACATLAVKKGPCRYV